MVGQPFNEWALEHSAYERVLTLFSYTAPLRLRLYSDGTANKPGRSRRVSSATPFVELLDIIRQAHLVAVCRNPTPGVQDFSLSQQQ